MAYREEFEPVKSIVFLFCTLKTMYPSKFCWRAPEKPNGKYYFDLLAGTSKLRNYIDSGIPPEKIYHEMVSELDNFKDLRAKYIIY